MSIASASALALKGGTPVRPATKPWHAWPVYGDLERKALLDTLESGKWFLDARIKQFEHEYAAFQDAKYCVAVNSGTAGLEICLEALGVGPGDEVIVPPYTFIATASAAMRVGATVVFVDVNNTWNLDPDLLDAAITPRTKAIMPVH
ncbi:MAG: aminotransferase class I/II-fold pyridoxal phosphate-dependent enzyme, partial [Candidatus Hydrogenedentes bacterium]|nr:aminotransferase class I/II-fold pyridoxal phosphate-dependent enzyme [Candidatus Hydrogenedentota bacterium]